MEIPKSRLSSPPLNPRLSILYSNYARINHKKRYNNKANKVFLS